MVIKAFFIVLAFCAYQGHGVKIFRLEDVDVNIIRDESKERVLSFPIPFFDKLITCRLTYPNGKIFEAFPKNNLPDVNIYFDSVPQPFTICSIGFRNASTNFSGTYELESIVVSSAHQHVTVTRQRFNVRITEF